MKDFCTGRDINIELLEEVYKLGVEAECRNDLEMWHFVNFCDTAGCLVGTYCLKKKLYWSNRYYYYQSPSTLKAQDMADFGIIEANLSHYENSFIFVNHHTKMENKLIELRKKDIDRCIIFKYLLNKHSKEKYSKSTPAMDLPGKDALHRLRKFIDYKKRKAELLENYEVARRQEGNWMILKSISEGVAT